MTGFFGPDGPAGGQTLDQIVAAVIAKLQTDPEAAARIHQAADVDSGPPALHHTLGLGSGESAAGNHLHDARYLQLPNTVAKQVDHPRTWQNFSTSSSANATIVLATAETADALGDVPFQARAERDYTFIYVARFVATGAAVAVDARLRIRSGNPPSAPTNTDTQVGEASIPIFNLGGSGADSRTVLGHRRCNTAGSGADILPGLYRFGAFFDVTAGTGTLTVDQPTNGRRQLVVIESPSAV